jgi:Chaperone of endosialidase
LAKITADRVLETSTTTGTGTYALSGAVAGFRAASSVCANNDTFDYYAEEVNGAGQPTGNWETGLGTWTTGNNLARTTIYSSSNANAAVSWAAGTKRIALALVAASFPSITNDTTTNGTRYILFDDVTSGPLGAVGTSSTKLYFNPSTGQLNANAFNSLSDANAKENVQTISNATAIVRHLQGVEFDWKDTKEKSAGVIAQELEKILPHLVYLNPNTGIRSVNYSGVIGYLIESIKELESRIKHLEK